MRLLYLLLPSLILCMDPSIIGNVTSNYPQQIADEIQKLLDGLHLPHFAPQLNISGINLSVNCKEELLLLANGVQSLLHNMSSAIKPHGRNVTASDKHYALSMLDSSAKISPGIMRGNVKQVGFYDECKKISYFSQELGRTLYAEYFRIFIDTSFHQYTDQNACQNPRVSTDLCLPASCTSEEIARILRSVSAKNKSSPICQVTTINELVPEPILGTYIIWVIFVIIVSFCLICGLVDYFFLPKESYIIHSTYDFGWRIVECFSFHRNVKGIFQVEEHKEEHIATLNGIRTLGMFWIISCHALIFCALFASNPLDLLDYGKKWRIQPFANGYFSVDTFFFLSGLLLGFIWFKMLFRDMSNTMSLKGWVMFYLHRFLRISPAYYMSVLFFTFVFTTLLKNMPVLAIPELQHDTCRNNWWINLLYLNNYVKESQMCFVISWYLATDMQIFLASPLLLIPFALFGAKIGVSACFFVLAATTGASVYQTYYFNLPPSPFHYGHEKDMGSDSDYLYYQYYSPYIRAQVYIIGLLTGYLLQTYKKLQLPKFLILVLYCISISMMLLVIFGLRGWINGEEMTLFQSAIYNAFSRPAWALGLSWIVTASFYGFGGPFGAFLSWWVWTPLGRLSFCAYLTHIPVIVYVWGLDQTQRVFTGLADFTTTQMLPAILYSYIAAIFWSAFFEIPFAKLESLFLGKKTGKKSDVAHILLKPDKATMGQFYSNRPVISVTNTSQNWT